MVAGLVVRLVKAPENMGGSTPALGVRQKIHQHLVYTKNCQYLVFTSKHHQAFTSRLHQIQTVATHSGWASLIQRTFAALLIGVKNTEDRVEQFVAGF